MTKPKPQPASRPSEQPDESLLDRLDGEPRLEAQVVNGKIVETWVRGKRTPRR